MLHDRLLRIEDSNRTANLAYEAWNILEPIISADIESYNGGVAEALGQTRLARGGQKNTDSQIADAPRSTTLPIFLALLDT
jgi:hypothetical protein